ncbi:MAG: 30S ribosomal protein S9 [Pseudomonadota bacterium]
MAGAVKALSTRIKKWFQMPKERYVASGGRKTSMARVYVFPNTTKKAVLIVNGVDGSEYFSKFMLQKAMRALMHVEGGYSAVCKITGGGTTGQSEAINHAIAKALSGINSDFKRDFRKEGFLTRDARMVESKTAGKHKARRSKQWSKR